MKVVVVAQNRFARVLSHARGSSYEVQEKVDGRWERITEFYGPRRDVALSVYNRLTRRKKLYKEVRIALRQQSGRF